MNGGLGMWRQGLEAHGFRLSRSKKKYMDCKFSKKRITPILLLVTQFKYEGSIQNAREIEGDISHEIQEGRIDRNPYYRKQKRKLYCIIVTSLYQLISMLGYGKQKGAITDQKRKDSLDNQRMSRLSQVQFHLKTLMTLPPLQYTQPCVIRCSYLVILAPLGLLGSRSLSWMKCRRASGVVCDKRYRSSYKTSDVV